MNENADRLASRERVFALLGSYEKLLTETQAKITNAYYIYDLSLSEIAEQEKISRAAVSEALRSSIDKMEEFDTKLQLVEKKGVLKALLHETLQISDPKKRLEALSKIAKEVSEDGI